MATTIQRSYTNSSGTLIAVYHYNRSKQKNQLHQFCHQTTTLDLSQVWINASPAAHLKGFKSYILPEKGVSFTHSHNIVDITVPSTAPGSPFPTLQLTLKILGQQEQTLSLQLPQRLTIAGLQAIVSRKLGLPLATSLEIQLQGDALDPKITLSDCGIENGAELTLNLDPQAKSRALPAEKITNHALEMGNVFDFVKPDAPKLIPTVNATDETPIWKLIYPGLSLLGTCSNSSCKAFGEKVHIKKGMGTFEMSEECAEATCPACDQSFEKDVNNCGFSKCIYTIQGMMQDKTKFFLENQSTPAQNFVTFEEKVGEINKISQWKYLKITTKPLN